MKKILLSLALISAANASEISDKTLEFIKKLLPPQGVEVKLVSSEKIAGSNYEMVEFNIVSNGVVVGSDAFFSDGKYATPQLFDMSNSKDLKAEFSKKKEELEKAKLVSKLPSFLAAHKDIVIRLGSKNNGSVTAVFSDPECPWCRKHLQNIESEIAKSDLAIVLTPLPMHKGALSKTVKILEEIKGAKTDAAKIAVLRKYFADDVKFSEPSQKSKDEYSKVVEAAFDLGVNYTPAIFENVKF